MTDDNTPIPEPAQEPATAPGPDEPAPAAAAPQPAPAGMSAAEELAALRDRHLRLAADFDNFRKRAIKERTEAWERAQMDFVLRLTDALDDLARFAHVSPAETDAERLHAGVDMVERKIWKELSGLGVSRIDQTGVPFDPNQHEAVTTAAAPQASADHTVGAVFQAGYRFGKTLLRPARVQVLTWTGDDADQVQH
jgi:molecular chaperone GrpE